MTTSNFENDEFFNDFSTSKLLERFDERSDAAEAIISSKPSFFEKWGLYIFLLLFFIIIVATKFIKYPDIVEGRALLTSENAPKEIIAKQSGKLLELFVQNNQEVRPGQLIGWLEGNAAGAEVLELSQILDSSLSFLDSDNLEIMYDLFNVKFDDLGEIQMAYQTFVAAWQLYYDYLDNGYYPKRKNLLNKDIIALEEIKRKTLSQRDLVYKDRDLAVRTFEMNELLFREKIISAEEYRQAQSILANKEKLIPQIDVDIISQQNLIRDKQKEIDRLNHDISQQKKVFEQALYTLKSKVDEWLRVYTLTSPSEGRLVFILPIQKKQYVHQGKLLGYVNPPDSRYYVEVKLSQSNFGKVDTGMDVQLRFDAYPYQEIGTVSGKLSYVSSLAVDSGFLGTVRLDKGLQTNQRKQIQYKNGLRARALIITKDISLLERLYYSIIRGTSLNK